MPIVGGFSASSRDRARSRPGRGSRSGGAGRGRSPRRHVADDLPLEDALAFRHRGVVEIPVEAVVAAPVVEQHRGEVRPEPPGETYGAARDGAYGGPLWRGDADAVPRDPRVARTGGGAELVDDLAVDGPV